MVRGHTATARRQATFDRNALIQTSYYKRRLPNSTQRRVVNNRAIRRNNRAIVSMGTDTSIFFTEDTLPNAQWAEDTIEDQAKMLEVNDVVNLVLSTPFPPLPLLVLETSTDRAIIWPRLQLMLSPK